MVGQPVFIHRVRLRNYKSIAACDVNLGPLSFLVGPNGAGKSNFVDALRLLSESLHTTLDHALRNQRGGVKEVRRRSSGHPTNFGIRVDFCLPGNGQEGHYAFRIGAAKDGGFQVQQEECRVGSSGFRVAAGKVIEPPGVVVPPAASDRLYLTNASGLPEFRPVFDALSAMRFYNINPDRLRQLQTPDKGDVLDRDGGNAASVIEKLEKREPATLERIEDFLSKVVPGVEGVRTERMGHMESIEFRQRVMSAPHPWRFPALNMSDGTLRALGVLVALFQRSDTTESWGGVPLVGIEEPEAALHPAAAGVLIDALFQASRTRQVVVTSHSPELLDDERLTSDHVVAVLGREGCTEIGAIDEAGRIALLNHLYTAGELLRLDQLQPGPAAAHHNSQLRLFDEEVGEQ